MQQLRKDNHYVPKLYLKQWADQGFIPTYRLLVPSENVSVELVYGHSRQRRNVPVSASAQPPCVPLEQLDGLPLYVPGAAECRKYT